MILENTHEPIISKEEWLETQKLINSRRSAPPRAVSSRYIFSSKLKCKYCGKNLVGGYTTHKNTKGETVIYPQYRCRRGREGRCDGKVIVAERRVEEAFLDYLNQFSYEDYFESVSVKGEAQLNKKEEIIDIEEL